MRCLFGLGFVVIFGGLALGCGSKSVNALDSKDSKDKTDGGGPGSGSDSNTNPEETTPKACDSDPTSIAGTWNVIGSGSSSTTSQITIDADTFTFKGGKSTLRYHAEGETLSLQWTDEDGVTDLTAAHEGSGTEGGGVIPLPIEGDWTFGSDSSAKSCTTSLKEGELTAGCNASINTPVARLNRTFLGERTEKLPSVFGALGGKWHLVASSLTLDVTFSKNTFKATASDHGKPTDNVTFTVCAGTASGTTSSGHEFAAVRE